MEKVIGYTVLTIIVIAYLWYSFGNHIRRLLDKGQEARQKKAEDEHRKTFVDMTLLSMEFIKIKEHPILHAKSIPDHLDSQIAVRGKVRNTSNKYLFDPDCWVGVKGYEANWMIMPTLNVETDSFPKYIAPHAEASFVNWLWKDPFEDLKQRVRFEDIYVGWQDYKKIDESGLEEYLKQREKEEIAHDRLVAKERQQQDGRKSISI